MKKHLSIEKKIQDLDEKAARLARESAFLRTRPDARVEQLVSMQEEIFACQKQAEALRWVLGQRSSL